MAKTWFAHPRLVFSFVIGLGAAALLAGHPPRTSAQVAVAVKDAPTGASTALRTIAPPISTFASDDPIPRLHPTRTILFSPDQPLQAKDGAWTFCHHPYITAFGSGLVAMWSNAPRDEDSRRQRVLWSRTVNGVTWTPPQPLMEPTQTAAADSSQTVLTAAGFYEYEGALRAYVAQYDQDRTHSHLWALTSKDGVSWDRPADLGLAICPNDGPRRLRSGRLMICGNTAFPCTAHPGAISGWKMNGIFPSSMTDFEDNPRTFWDVQKFRNWPAALCEGSFIQTPDGIIRMMLRSAGPTHHGTLWMTVSTDDGATWSTPVDTTFPDNDHKFQFGTLRDGRYFYLGTPDALPHATRRRLVLSLSDDGLRFDKHYLIADEPYAMKHPGRAKFGEYGYPHLAEVGGCLHMIVSRQKEAIEVLTCATPKK